MVDYGYDPFPADSYDPFGADSYDPFPVEPLPEVAPEPTAPQGGAAPASEASAEPASVPTLLPWYEYAAKTGNTIEVYNDYVTYRMPDYLTQLGYTPAEVADVIKQFKKQVPSPLNRVPDRSLGEAASDVAQKLGSGVVGFVDKALEFSKITDTAIPAPIRAMRDSMFPTIRKDAKDFLTEQKDNINAELSPTQQALDKNFELKKEEGIGAMLKYAVTNPAILAATIIESAPEMAATMGGAAKVGEIALKQALASGATREVAEAAAKKVATYASMAAEGTLGAAGVSSDVNTAMDKVRIYDGVDANGLDKERKLTPNERAMWNLVALPAGVITAAAGRFSPFEISLFTSKLASQGVPKSLWGKFVDVVGAGGKNAFEEYVQSGNEKMWTNVGSKQVWPTDIKAWVGVGTEAAYGALTGAAQAGPTRAGGMLLDTIRGRNSATETPATETPATETPATETPATETPATETPTTETPTTETPAKPDLTFEELIANLDESIPPEQRTASIEQLIQNFDQPTTNKEATFKELTKELEDAGIRGINIEELLTGIKEQVVRTEKPASFTRLNKEISGLSDVPVIDFTRLTSELRQVIPEAAYTPSIEELLVALDKPTTPDKQATFEELTAELQAEGVAKEPTIESFLTQIQETIKTETPVPQARPVTPAAPTPVDFGTLTDELRDAIPEYAKSPLIDTFINELDDPLSPNKEGMFAALTREIAAQRQNSAPDPFMDALLDGIRSKIEAATAVAPDALQLNTGVPNESQRQDVTSNVRKNGYENGQKNEGQGRLQEGQKDGRQGNGEGQSQEVLIPKQPEGIQQVYPRIKTDAGNLPLQFANDVDRALYVVGRTQRRDATASDLGTWLQEKVFPGEGRNQIKARAAAVVQAAKAQIPNMVRGDTKVIVPAQFKTGPGDAAIREARVAGTEPELSADQETALAQMFPNDQLPEGTSAVSAAAQIAGAQDAIQKSSNASQLAAYIAADSEPVRPRFGNNANQAGTRQSGAASSAQVNSAGGEKVQLRLSRRGVRSGKGNSTSTGDSPRTVAEGRKSVLDAEPIVMRPYEEKALEKFALELSLLAGKVNEAEDLANYFQSRVDEGYGSPTVDPKKLERARQIQREANEVTRMRKGPITPEALALITDPVTGEIFDTKKVRAALEASKLPESTLGKIKTGDVRSALADLANNGSTPLVRGFALRLSDVYLGGATIKIQPIDKAKGVAGRFKAVEKLILIDPDTGLNERVFLHEAAHAATVHALANPVTREQRKAVAELTDIYNRAKQSVDPEEYGMRNIAEFIAEAFSNPNFQYQLYKASAPDTPSFWQRFVSAVVKLLGMDNLLGRTANVAEALFIAPTAEPKITQGQYDALMKGPEPATIRIERDSDSIVYMFDNELSILNLGKQVEKTVAATGNTLDSGLNLKEVNTLNRADINAWMTQWEDTHWKPLSADARRIIGKFSIPLKTLEGYLTSLDAIGRTQVKIAEFDPLTSGYKTLVKDAQDAYVKANNTITDLQKNKPAVYKELIGLAKKINAATAATLMSQVEADNSGMTKERVQKIQRAFTSPHMPEGFYVPQQKGVADGGEVGVLRTSTGRSFEGKDPLSIIYAQAALTAQSNFRNKQKQVVLGLAEKYNLVDAKTDKPLFKIGPVVELKRDKTTGMISEGQNALLFDPNAINVWKNGQLKKISVENPALKEMLQRTPEPERAALVMATIGVFRYFTTLMGAARTGLSYFFPPKNFLRDSGITVPANLDPRVSIAAYTAALPGAFTESFQNTYIEAFGGKATGRFAEASKAGAFISQRNYLGLTDTVRNVTLDLEPTLSNRMKAGLVAPLDSQLGQIALAYSQALENTTRLAVYDAAITSLMPANPTPEQKAATIRTAAYIAKTTTVNFERSSQMMQTFGPFYLFLRPKLLGTKQLFDKAVGGEANARTQAVLAGLVAIGFIAGAIGYSNDERDENGVSKYKKIPGYKRDSNIILGEGQVGMPLPQETGLFYILGNSVADIVYGDDDVGTGLARFMKATVQQLSPFASAQTDPTSSKTNKMEWLARLFLPSVVQPVELAFGPGGRDTFGRDIVPQSMRFKGKPEYQKFTRGESPTSIEIAKTLFEKDVIDVSPAVVTYMAKWLEGGSISGLKNLFEEGDKNTLTKKFIMSASPYYDSEVITEATAELKRVAERAKVGSLSERAAYYNEHRAEIDLAAEFERVQKRKTTVTFKNYAKMTDEQLAAANIIGTKADSDLLAKWYALKGKK